MEICQSIFESFQGKLAQLSIQKFSSNVIEKCMEKAPVQTVYEYFTEIANIESLFSNISLLIFLVRHYEEFLWKLRDSKSFTSCRRKL
jgi:hypothetical protein